MDLVVAVSIDREEVGGGQWAVSS